MTSVTCSVHTARAVEEFLELLLPSHIQWKSAKRGDLAYRGQSSSAWPLTPRAFRTGESVGYGPNEPKANLVRVVPQARAEFRAVSRFVRIADGSGLQVTDLGARLLLEEDPTKIFADSDWEYSWPQEQIIETLALAQHHGVPTRFLDFTEDPLIAAYFAAANAWNPKKGSRITGKERRYLSVWVIDLRFVKALNSIGGRYPERIREIRVPRANNSYLHAQQAFFLTDRGANDVMARGEPLSIDNVIAERAGFWHNGKRLAWKRTKSDWFDDLPIRQIRLSTRHTGHLLRELANRGVTVATIMPNLDRVVEALEIERSLPNE
ncbi:MAG: FRG domain-containing protein [Chloroflexota bacterium]|nr:FRG domain-containing protein [Chloroflexota bacterium]